MMGIGDFHVRDAEEMYERLAKAGIEQKEKQKRAQKGNRTMIEPQYRFSYDAGSLYIHEIRGVTSRTTVVPLHLAVMSCEILQSCKTLLSFIEAHNMGGDWCQNNYPTIREARATIRKAENNDFCDDEPSADAWAMGEHVAAVQS